ncbi:allophanate hydrolase subunit 1 [Marinobacterium maritimum]|uniref:Allophanate hydrolase subunit 1 n=1 Tax=Marinobacterium maritimum TaxID=500162 RepID=A0ABN1I4F8_9GAMM
MIHWSIENAGPDALIIRFGQQIDETLVPLIRAASDLIAAELSDQLRDLVPSYTTLMVVYDPLRTDFAGMVQKINARLSTLEVTRAETGRRVEIPVYYDPEVGPDLERVARLHGISTDEVIRLHTARDYHVFAIGFAPGFAYMGQVDPALRTPRLETPRTRVPVGSVALADQQTAVYPVATPGGWNILGRTPVKMFDPALAGLCPVEAGDRVRFVSISKAEFLAAGGELE